MTPHFARQLAVGIWGPLDKSKLSNIGNIDAGLMAKLAEVDPGNTHGVPWMWGTTGIIFNVEKVRSIIPDAPVDSWAMFFDPAIAAKFEKCGIAMLDDAEQVLGAALIYLGKPADSEEPADLDAAVEVLRKVRPFVRKFHGSEYTNGLANGEYCVAIGYSGEALIAQNRSKEAGRNFDIQYRIPKEGALAYTDVLAVPKDAPNPGAANAFINTMMRPEVAAAAAIETGFATANREAMKLVPAELTSNPNLYPPAEVIKRLTLPRVHSQKILRAWQKAWLKAKGLQ
jgi:putrescine transport system substrate-binding protein